jgi:hypothetical protein
MEGRSAKFKDVVIPVDSVSQVFVVRTILVKQRRMVAVLIQLVRIAVILQNGNVTKIGDV